MYGCESVCVCVCMCVSVCECVCVFVRVCVSVCHAYVCLAHVLPVTCGTPCLIKQAGKEP